MFVLTGVVNTLLGPMLPVLVEWWALADAGAGLLFTMQFGGSMLGAALTGLIIPRVGFRSTLLAGNLLMAAGVFGLGLDAPAFGYAAVCGYGFGLGLTIPATNLLVAERFPASRASALSLLNLCWGLGAVSGPPVVALLHRTYGARVFVLGLSAALVMCAGILATLRSFRDEARGTSPDTVDRPVGAIRRSILFFGTFLFLYVGTETAVSGWIAVYAQRVDVLPPAAAVAVPSVFWGTLLLGRALAPLCLRRWAEVRLLGASLAVATIGVAALLLARSAPALLGSIVVAGVGMAAVFPVVFAIFTRDLDRRAASAAGTVFVFAGLGGATLPWIVGVVSADTGSLTAGLLVPLAGCAAMIALYGQRLVRSCRSAGL